MPILNLRGDPQALKEERKSDLRLKITQVVENARADQDTDAEHEIVDIIENQDEFEEDDFYESILESCARVGHIPLLSVYLEKVDLNTIKLRYDVEGENLLHLLCRSFSHEQTDLNAFLCRHFEEQLDRRIKPLLLERNHDDLTPLQVCAREVDHPTPLAHRYEPVGDKREREVRYASIAGLTLPYENLYDDMPRAEFNPYQRHVPYRSGAALDLLQPFRDVLADEECRACWSITESVLFHFDVNLAVNTYLSQETEFPSDQRGDGFLDMSTRQWIDRWQRPQHGGLTITAAELHHLHLKLREACVKGLVYRVQWYILFWDVPIDPPRGVLNPLGLSLMDYTIIGLSDEEMLTRTAGSTGSLNLGQEINAFGWSRYEFTTPLGMWEQLFASETYISEDKHSARYYLREILRPETRGWERRQIVRILLRQTGKLVVRLDQIIGHGRSEMLLWLITKKLIDLNRNVLVAADDLPIAPSSATATGERQAVACDSADSSTKDEVAASEMGVEDAKTIARLKREAAGDASDSEGKSSKRRKLASDPQGRNLKSDRRTKRRNDGDAEGDSGGESHSADINKAEKAAEPTLPKPRRGHDAECCVCLHVPRRWVQLVCHHEVCTGCAHQLILTAAEQQSSDNSSEGENDDVTTSDVRTITCPMCRASHPAPESATTSLEDPVEKLLLQLNYTAPALDEKLKDVAEAGATAPTGLPVVTLFELLLAFCANVGAVRPFEMLATNLDVLRLMGFDRIYTLFKDESPLHMAARAGKSPVVWFMLRSWTYRPTLHMLPENDSRSSDGYLPVHLAALGDHSGIVQLFIDLNEADGKDARNRTYRDLVKENRAKCPRTVRLIESDDAWEFLETTLPSMIEAQQSMDEIVAKANFESMDNCPQELFERIVAFDRLDVLEWCLKMNKGVDFFAMLNTKAAESRDSKVGKYLYLRRARQEIKYIQHSETFHELADGRVEWPKLKQKCEKWDGYYTIVNESLPKAETQEYKPGRFWARVLSCAVRSKPNEYRYKDDNEALELYRKEQCDLLEWVGARLTDKQYTPAVYSAWEYALLHNLPCVTLLKDKLKSVDFDFNSEQGGGRGTFNDRLHRVFMYQTWDTTRISSEGIGALGLLKAHMAETGGKLRDITPLETVLLSLELLQTPPVRAGTEIAGEILSQVARIFLHQTIGFYVEQLSLDEEVLQLIAQPMPRISMDLVDALIKARHIDALETLALKKGVNVQGRSVKSRTRLQEMGTSFAITEEHFNEGLGYLQELQEKKLARN